MDFEWWPEGGRPKFLKPIFQRGGGNCLVTEHATFLNQGAETLDSVSSVVVGVEVGGDGIIKFNIIVQEGGGGGGVCACVGWEGGVCMCVSIFVTLDEEHLSSATATVRVRSKCFESMKGEYCGDIWCNDRVQSCFPYKKPR